jgi:N-acetylmuramoyl-L-alanine amidase
MRICLDAGHGGYDPGAVGPCGLEEAGVVLAISKQVLIELRGYGIETFLTRDKDIFIELNKRCSIANEWGADFFVSIHANSDGPSAHGIETLYVSQAGKELAAPIQQSLVLATNETDRGLKLRKDLAVLNMTDMPAALTEIGFISHPQTEVKLGSASYQKLLAEAIVEGIIKGIKEEGIPVAPN